MTETPLWLTSNDTTARWIARALDEIELSLSAGLVVAVDPSPVMLDRLRRKIDEAVRRQVPPGPWWVVGGWAIEAFSGVHREHHDVDVAIFKYDLPALLELVGDRYDVWSVSNGSLRPINGTWPEPPPSAGQVWLREHAQAPWGDRPADQRGPRRAVGVTPRGMVRATR